MSSIVHPSLNKYCLAIYWRLCLARGLKIQDNLPYSPTWSHPSILVCSSSNRSTGHAPVPHSPGADLCLETRSSNTCPLLFSQHHTCGCNAGFSRWKRTGNRKILNKLGAGVLLFWLFYYFPLHLKIFQIVRAVNHARHAKVNIQQPGVISFTGLASHCLRNCLLKRNQNPPSKAPLT